MEQEDSYEEMSYIRGGKKTLIGIRLQKMLCKWKLVRKILLLHNIGNRANTILIDTHRLNP